MDYQSLSESSDRSSARFYENKIPRVTDIVLGLVVEKQEFGLLVELLEYSNITGFLSFNETSKTTAISKQKYRTGQKYPMQISSIDLIGEKTFIDLSTKFLSSQEKDDCIEKYEKTKKVISIMKYIAGETNFDIEKLCYEFIWKHEFDSPFQKFMEMSEGINIYPAGLDIPKNIIDKVINYSKQKLAPKEVEITSLIELTCFETGIDGIKNVLYKAKKEYPDIKISLKSSPEYFITAIGKKDVIMSKMNKMLEEMGNNVLQEHGALKIIREPSIKLNDMIQEQKVKEILVLK